MDVLPPEEGLFDELPDDPEPLDGLDVAVGFFVAEGFLVEEDDLELLLLSSSSSLLLLLDSVLSLFLSLSASLSLPDAFGEAEGFADGLAFASLSALGDAEAFADALADGDAVGSVSSTVADPQATSPPMSSVVATITPAARAMTCFFFLLRFKNFSFIIIPPVKLNINVKMNFVN